MSKEYFDIYNEEMEHIGVEPRSVVHEKGYWHKTFQCWFVFNEHGKPYILFQKRQDSKDTYPNLLDITAAGHLSAGEILSDGLRELEEELGVKADYEELIPLGVIKEKKIEDNFVDAEFGNVFLYYSNIPMEDFSLQVEEVAGMFKVNLNDAINLFEGAVKYINIEGYEMNSLGERNYIRLRVSIKDFVPHKPYYYSLVLSKAKEYLNTLHI